MMRLNPWRRALAELRRLPAFDLGPLLLRAFWRLAAIWRSLAIRPLHCVRSAGPDPGADTGAVLRSRPGSPQSAEKFGRAATPGPSSGDRSPPDGASTPGRLRRQRPPRQDRRYATGRRLVF